MAEPQERADSAPQPHSLGDRTPRAAVTVASGRGLPAAEVGIPSAAAARCWHTALIALACGLAVLLAVFWETAASAVALWAGSSSFGHCFLVLPISLFLIYQQRRSLARMTPRPSGLGCLAMLGATVLWLVGDIAGAQILRHFALVAMIQALCWSVLGTAVVRALAFPLFYLYFAVPFGLFMIAPLQDFTAAYVVWLLQLTGMPVYLDGIMIYIPSGAFEVAEACAGVRYLISMLAFGALGAHLLFTDALRRAVFVGLSIVMPIIANGVRGYGIVMMAHLSDYKIAVSVDHLIYGWVFFSVVTFCLIGIGMLMRARWKVAGGKRPEPSGPPDTRPAPAIAGFFLVGVAAVLLAGAGPAYSNASLPPRDWAPPTANLPLPQADGYASMERASADWRPTYADATRTALQTFRQGDLLTDLFIAYYAFESEEVEVVGAGNRLSDKRWSRIGGGTITVRLEGRSETVRELQLRSGTNKRLVWYWYWVDGRYTADPFVAKLYRLKVRLFGGRSDVAAIAVSAVYGSDIEEARWSLQRFLDALSPVGGGLAAWSP